MKTANLIFWIVLAGIVLSVTIRGLRKTDFSASGVRITREKTPVGFRLVAVCHLLACALLVYVIVVAACRPSAAPQAANPGVNLQPLSSDAGLNFANLTWRERKWQIVEVDAAVCPVRLRLAGNDGRPTRDFPQIIEEEKAAGRKTKWMMNAGMFRDDGMPVGLCIVDGKEITPLRTEAGEGKFLSEAERRLRPN